MTTQRCKQPNSGVQCGHCFKDCDDVGESKQMRIQAWFWCTERGHFAQPTESIPSMRPLPQETTLEPHRFIDLKSAEQFLLL